MPNRVSTNASLGFKIFKPGMRNKSSKNTSEPTTIKATARGKLFSHSRMGPAMATARLPKNSTKISASMAKPFLVFTGFSV